MSQNTNARFTRSLKTSTHWVIVASRSGARLFESAGPGQHLRLLRDIPNPAGRLRGRDLNSDRPGRCFAGHGLRHGMSSRVMAIDVAADSFARILAGILEDGRARSLFQRLILVAEPRFLGRLRGILTRQTARLVDAMIEKELNVVRPRELERELGDVLRAA